MPRPPYARGCYAIPIRFLYGTAAEINFWDVVYFQAHQGEGEFDTSTQELVERVGISRQMIGRLRRQAVEHGELIEDLSWVSGHRFVLRVPDFERLRKGVIWKPLGYVRNGWHHIVTPAIPKRVLNLYLQQPRQQVYNLGPQYIAAKCKRRYLQSDERAVTPLNLADVGKALRLLMRLGLLTPEGDGFRLEWQAFNRSAPDDVPPFNAPDPRESALFRQAADTDPGRAERALEILETGRYRMEAHFSDIFRDLAYVRREDYQLLKAKAHRRRNRPPNPNRWRNTWKAFQYELERRSAEIQGPKQTLGLEGTRPSVCQLGLNLDQIAGDVLAVRLVSRVEWPWHIETGRSGEPTVKLNLSLDDDLLFARAVEPGDAEVRYNLHPEAWPGATAQLTLAARCDRPLPSVRVEAWLEARIRR